MRLGRMSAVRPIRVRCGIRDECPAWLMFRSSGVLSTRSCCRGKEAYKNDHLSHPFRDKLDTTLTLANAQERNLCGKLIF